ncbi:putative cell division cycle protein 91 [Lyophyllum shimeji]|uniref:Cell division cycle protein 91 n=1 Tax=Lyophyllum shimeji TaxID=47721 RepID=A0A9P3ULX7_LYOSH|nr:putative cell division cycle protein 91 [Lyophyllum shimeji]
MDFLSAPTSIEGPQFEPGSNQFLAFYIHCVQSLHTSPFFHTTVEVGQPPPVELSKPGRNDAPHLGIAFPALVAARLLLSLTSLPDVLKDNHLLSSALTSYSNLQEGIYLFQNGVDPYSGGSFRHSPIFLSLFTTLLPVTGAGSSILWTLCDAVGAWALINIWRARQRVSSSQRDPLIAAMYLLNPYVCLPSLARSTSSFENTLMLLSLMFASQGRVSASLLSLAFLVHLSLSSILILTPLLLLLLIDPVSRLASPKSLRTLGVDFRLLLPNLGVFLLCFCTFAVAATLVSGGWAWIPQTWGANLTLPDLTPNTGLWWYFFTEMFDHFRPFFLMVFSVHLLIYIAPICIKFQYDPLYAAFLLIGILGTFKAYPTLSDPGLFLSMIAIFPEVYPHLRHPIVTGLLHLHAALLMPLFNQLWLNQGTGNANFYYASTLVFACSNGAALIDCMWAGLRIAIGEEKEECAVVQE